MNTRMAALRRRFVERSRTEGEALRLAIGIGDVAQVRQIAHRLSGAGGMFGYPEISTGAATLEAAVDRDPLSIGPAAEAILSLLDRLE